jgi:hypothetical protein
MLAYNHGGTGVVMALLEEPIAETVAPPVVVVREKRRWPWLIALVAALVLLASAVGAYVWAAHYQPLVVGSSWGSDSGGTQAQELSAPGSVMTPYDYYAASTGTQFLVIDPKPGQQFWFRTELSIQGQYPVKVVGINTDFDCCSYKPVKTNRYITSADTGFGADFGNTSPFDPFVLDKAANKGRGIKVVFTVPSCARRDPTLPPVGPLTPYNGMSISSYTVKYKFLWFTHTVNIPLQERLEIINLPLCPGR